jgi:hypothetical protein
VKNFGFFQQGFRVKVFTGPYGHFMGIYLDGRGVAHFHKSCIGRVGRAFGTAHLFSKT